MLEKVRERTAMEEKRRKGYRNGLWAVVFLAVLAALVFFLISYWLFCLGAFSGRYAGIYCPLFSVFLWRLFSGAASVGGGSADPQQCNEFGWGGGFWHAGGFLAHLCCRGIGSLLVFQLTRRLGRPFAERFVSRGNMDKYRDMIERKQDVFFCHGVSAARFSR